MLTHLLGGEDYALALTPGFFRFYAHIGVLQALEECSCLRPSHIVGSSAGALVGAFLAAGMKPKEMADAVLAIEREHVWDVGGIGGLLKGQLFEQMMEKHLPVNDIEQAPIPFCATAYDLLRFRTTYITTGKLSIAARASCTFPGLFQPVMINNSPHIDGGVWDHVGLMGLEEAFRIGKEKSFVKESSALSTKSEGGEPRDDSSSSAIPVNKLIVNVVFGTAKGSSLPKSMKRCRLLTIVMENVPMVTPFTMNTAGKSAFKLSRAAMRKAMFGAHIQASEPLHWICYVDASRVREDEPDTPLPKLVPAIHDEEDEVVAQKQVEQEFSQERPSALSLLSAVAAAAKDEAILVSPDAVVAVNTPFSVANISNDSQTVTINDVVGISEGIVCEPNETLSSKYYFQEVDPETVNTFIADFGGQSDEIDGELEASSSAIPNSSIVHAPTIADPTTLPSKVSFCANNDSDKASEVNNPPTTPHSSKNKLRQVPSFSFINGTYTYYESAISVPQEIERVKLKRALSLCNDLSAEANSVKYSTTPYSEKEIAVVGESHSSKRQKRE